MWRLLSNAHDLGPNASCQIPTISPKALDLWKCPPLNIFIFVISLCAGRKKRVIWITIPGWTTQIRVPPAPHWLPASPVNTGPSIEALRLGVGIFFSLTYFYFNALENPETFLFYRHAFAVALSFMTTKWRRSSTVVGSGLSSARIFQGLCTSMLPRRRSRSGCWLAQL